MRKSFSPAWAVLSLILVVAVGVLAFLLARRASTPGRASTVIINQQGQAAPNDKSAPIPAPSSATDGAPRGDTSRDGTYTPPQTAGGTTGTSALDATPHICDSDWSPLGCSYRFKLDGQDLVPATATESVQARLALVGPAYATDASGQRVALVRVRVSAFLGSVSVNPAEFIFGASYSSSTPVSTVPVPGVTDQVLSQVSVAKGTGFIGTLAFRDQSGIGHLHIAWLRSSGEPAATWTVN